MRRFVLTLGVVWACLCVSPGFAQIPVFDPENYANALLRFEQLRQEYTQLVQTYNQIREEYRLLFEQSRRIPVLMNVRYRITPTPWLFLSASQTFGTTAGWILTANTGHDATAAYQMATSRLRDYGVSLASVPADEATRLHLRHDRLQLTDATIAHGLEALGFLRGHQTSVESALRSLEDDAFADDAAYNTQVAVLNKINATAVTTARLTKDANNVLVSLLEERLIEATERREAVAAGTNAHVAFEIEARPLLARTTAFTTDALTTFRIPD